MLSKCPECNLQISTKAAFCPHCGYVVSGKPVRLSAKRKRLPNGFGQISEIKGRNLRNPYRVMVPAGKDENGRPISKLLKPKAYFKTYNEAYVALVEYNKSPYDPKRDPTFEELYAEWFESVSGKLVASTLRTHSAAFAGLKKLHKYNISQIRPYNIREAIETSDKSDVMKSKMKILCNMLYDYAIEREISQRNYARELKLGIYEKSDSEMHHDYTDEEMVLMWENISNPLVFAQIMQCYTGFRPQEILNIKLSDIDLDQMTITGGIKTEAGKNRIVPIHPLLNDLIISKYNESKKNDFMYLINNTPKCKEKAAPIAYSCYLTGLKRFWKKYNKQHLLHDGRVHFVTMAKRNNVDEYAIKRIVGHKIDDLTERVYTKRDIEWLKSEISKIPPGEFFGFKK